MSDSDFKEDISSINSDTKEHTNIKKETTKFILGRTFGVLFAVGLGLALVVGFLYMIVFSLRDISKNSESLKGKINNQPYVQFNDDTSSEDISLVRTGKTVSVSYQFEDLSVGTSTYVSTYYIEYDANTKLVYLLRGDSIIPYMRNATSQYIWDEEKNDIVYSEE